MSEKEKMQTIKLQGKDYSPVKERVKAFHNEYSNGKIITEWGTAFEGENNAIIYFKANVTPDVKNSDRSFTGHSLGKIANEKAFEKLETIAVGRALANAGFLSDGDIASADEMERYLNQDANPHENPPKTANLPPAITHLQDRYPFDGTLKCPKDSHKPYLNDGSEELRNIEQDIVDGTLDPRYIRYFYTCTNSVWEYLQSIKAELDADKQLYEAREA